jgi:hypothetical protein
MLLFGVLEQTDLKICRLFSPFLEQQFLRRRGAPNTKNPIQKAWVPESNKNKTPRPHTIHIITMTFLVACDEK